MSGLSGSQVYAMKRVSGGIFAIQWNGSESSNLQYSVIQRLGYRE